MFAYCLNNPVIASDPTGKIAISTLILIGSAIFGAACAGYTAYKEYQAGFSTGRIICDSFVAGLSGFSVAYTCGMSAYQCYQNFCYLNGLTPITNIGNTPSANTVTLYRAVSPAEYASATSTQQFSAGENSYMDQKYFATTYADAQKWGDSMYKGSEYSIITATFNENLLNDLNIMHWDKLDAIGEAFLIPISALNKFVISIL